MKYPICTLILSIVLLSKGHHLQAGTAELDAIVSEEWQYRLEARPRFATQVGVSRYNHLLGSVAEADLRKQADYGRTVLQRLALIDRKALPREAQVNYDIFKEQVEDAVASFDFGAWQIPLNSDSGFYSSLAFLPRSMPFNTITDYENYVSRLGQVGVLFGQHMDNMKTGLARGMTLQKAVTPGLDQSIASFVVENARESVFYDPFTRFPERISKTQQEQLIREAEKVILGVVMPAYTAFHKFWLEEYLPGARDTIAAHALPDGKAYYAQRVKHHTTLDLTPVEIHAVGLAEVKRIRAAMEAIILEVEFDGSFAEFIEFLRTDSRFYAISAKDLLKEAAYIAKQADAKLPAYFGRLPRLPYGIAPVPEGIAPKYTTGRYISSPTGSTEPGYYWVNTYKLENRPLYVLEALTLHEAVPGHHLQFALSREQDELPDFRRYSYISAFGEGWGLYSEYLGIEMGFYQDPYSRFGRLSYEMWRAIRLVVDTGMHAMGWSRQQALDLLANNTALSIHNVTTEVDRYISWPGQALAYKMGEIKMKELRARAEKALGAEFDIRAFHDMLLANGSIPLRVLEEEVALWITRVKSSGA